MYSLGHFDLLKENHSQDVLDINISPLRHGKGLFSSVGSFIHTKNMQVKEVDLQIIKRLKCLHDFLKSTFLLSEKSLSVQS